MGEFKIYKNVALRPIFATQMLWNHRRTLGYLLRNDRKSLKSHIFTTYFIRGEDCGKGVFDPIWKLTGWSPFLWDLEMEVTTRCYLKCIHCEHTYWENKSYLNQDLKFETFKKVIDEVPNLHWINLTGEGSCVLNPDFNKMVEYVKSKGIYLDFSHDFVKLPDETALHWVKCGVDRIYWSLDGITKETYEKIRVGANFYDVIGNIQKLLNFKRNLSSCLPEICFRFAFFKDNIQEVEYLPRFLSSLVGYDEKRYGDEPSINIVALLEFEETKGWECEIPNAIIRKVGEDARRYGFKVYWSHLTHIEEDKPPLDYCTFWSEPYIMITGHVVPCCAVLMSNNRRELEELSFGNINEKPLREIWFSENYKDFRKQVVDKGRSCPKICRGCRVFNTKERI